jgi:DNA modification methylase
MGDLLDSDISAVITDPPYGVNLEGKITKHTWREASTTYQDDEDYVKNEIVPRVRYAIERWNVALITPGMRNIFAYPEPREMGCVFFPTGAGSSRWGFGTFNPILFYGSDPYLVAGLGRRPNGVAATHWLCDEMIDHPCSKPLAWMEWMVERGSLKGQTVLDPFCGSGTTLIAAKMLERHFLGFEISARYCEIARERLNVLDMQMQLDFEAQPAQMELA